MRDPANEQNATPITPLGSLLVKVHSRCNLMCDYCYEYNCGNTSWRKKPKEMSEAVYEQMLLRVREHSLRHGAREQFFSLHGGEPLLRRLDFFRYAVARAREVLGPEITVQFGTQTNATLMTAETVELFAELGIGVGVSIDGPEPVHNKNRVYSNGRPSYQDTLAGLQHLLTERGRTVFGGILAVMDVTEDPLPVFEHLAVFAPPSIDFLEPHGSWDDLPVPSMPSKAISSPLFMSPPPWPGWRRCTGPCPPRRRGWQDQPGRGRQCRRRCRGPPRCGQGAGRG